MWWKRIIIGLIVLVAALYAAIYAFLHFYDLNRFKPRISAAAADAIGRTLRIDGDLEVDFGLLPLLAAENISLDNASWGSRTEMIRIERLQVRVALLPLVLGRVEIASILLVEPDILLERSESGDFNFPSVSGDTETAPNRIPLIHRIDVKKVRLVFDDRQAGRKLELDLESIRAELPDTDSPLEIDLEGNFNRTPVAVFGTIGRPLPAFFGDGPLPARLAVEIGGNRFQVAGVVENAADLSGLDLKITGAGKAIPELGRLAGVENLPDPGPFKFEVQFSGSSRLLTMSELNLHLGDRDLAQVVLRGRIGDLLHLHDVDLQIIADGDDLKNVGRLLGTTIPWQGAYRAAGRLVRSHDKEIRLDEIVMQVGDNDVAAAVVLDLQHAKPRLSATVRSGRFDLRPLFAEGAFQPLDTGGKTRPRASTSDSRARQQAQEPLLHRFDAEVNLDSGTVLLPRMVIQDMATEARLANGRIHIHTKGFRPPDLHELTGIAALPELGPIQLACDLVPTADGLSLRNIYLTAGSPRQARVTASGTIAELLQPKGFDLAIRIEGNDAASLEKYLLQPWPLTGRYTVSTRMVDSGKNIFTFESIAGSLKNIDFIGSVKVDASGKDTRVAIAASSPRFNLRPLVWSGLAIPEILKQMEDVGPLDTSLVLTVAAGSVGIADLQLRAGSADLMTISLQGSIRDAETLEGVRLALEAGGRELAALERLFGKAIPLQGTYGLQTALTDPKAGAYRFEPLRISLAGHPVAGFAEIDRSDGRMRVTADLSAREIDLNAMLPVAGKPDKPDKRDADWFGKALKQQRVLPQWSIPPGLIQNLDADIRIRVDRIKAAGLDFAGLSIDAKAQRNKIELDAEARTAYYSSGSEGAFDNFEMGQSILIIRGRATDDRMTIDSFTYNGGSPETVAVSLSGSVADTIGQTGIQFQFDIHGQEAGYLWQLLDLDFRATGPFALTGKLVDPRRKKYSLEELKATVGESSIDGRLSVDYTGQRPRFTARIGSPHLDLRPYLPEAVDAAGPSTTPAEGPGRKTRLFSNEPWPLEMVRKIDLSVSMDVARFYSSYKAAQDLRFDLSMEDGELKLKPFHLISGGGKITGELNLKTSADIPMLEAKAEIVNYDFGREMDELGRPQSLQGPLSGRIELKGPAESMAAFTGELNGRVVFAVSEGKIDNRIIGIVYGDISDTLLNLVRPVSRKDSFINLNCLVQSFDIQNGLARHLGLLDTPQTTLVTTGTVDLGRERLNITLRSSPKTGLRVEGLGRIGFSLKRFTRPFKLSGTLTRPAMAVDTSQTALTIGTLLGGLALGPAGIAAILADVSIGDKNPCLAAMQGLEKGEQGPTEEELLQSGDLLDETADSLVKGGKKVVEEGKEVLKTSP